MTGITNVKQTFNSSLGVPSEGTGSPQHAIDNRGVNDMLVVDFNPNNVAGQDYWDVSSFFLGWTCQMLNYSNANLNNNTGICPSGQVGDPVNADAWLGGTGAINFNSVSFDASGVPTIAGQTFKTLALNPDGTIGTGARNNNGITDGAVGRYLVIAGSLSGHTDAFKVKSISAAMTTPRPPNGNQVPVRARYCSWAWRCWPWRGCPGLACAQFRFAFAADEPLRGGGNGAACGAVCFGGAPRCQWKSRDPVLSLPRSRE
jgi:hypothetical protein